MGTECEQKIADAFSKATTECNNLKDKAILCCDEPLKCTDEETQKLLDSINKQGASSSGISENCRKVKEKFSDIGNIVQKMAAKCDTIISSCKEHCNTQITETVPSVFNKYCSLDLNTEVSYDHNEHTCSEDLINNYVGKYIKELAPIPAQCESKQEKANQMAQSGEEVLKSALSAAKCEEQARGGQPPSNDTQANTGAGGTMKGPMASPPVPEDDLHSASLPGGTKGRAYEQGLENGVSDESGGGSTWSAKAAQSKQSPGQSTAASRALPSKTGSPNNKNANSKNIAETDPKNPKDIAENKSDEKSKDIENDDSKVSDKNIAENDPKNIDKKEQASQSKEKKAKEASNKTKKKGFFSKLKALFSKDKERDVASNKDNPTKKDQKKEQKKEAAKKDKKNKKDGISLRKFTKADAKKEQKKIPHWTQIKPQSNIHAKTSKYGSPHDNIFKRISTRITFMCRTDRILDCE